MPLFLDDPGASVALRRATGVPRRLASATSVGHTSSLLKTSAAGSRASRAARAALVVSKGSTSRKSTSRPFANGSALGENHV